MYLLVINLLFFINTIINNSSRTVYIKQESLCELLETQLIRSRIVPIVPIRLAIGTRVYYAGYSKLKYTVLL